MGFGPNSGNKLTNNRMTYNNEMSNLNSMANNSIIDMVGGDMQGALSKPIRSEQSSEEHKNSDLAEKISSSSIMNQNLRFSNQRNEIEENFITQDERKKMMESLKSMLINFKPNV